VRNIFILFLLSSTLVSRAYAYLAYAPNANLQEEVNSNPYRILPKSEHFSFALDADFYKPVFWGGNNFIYYKYDFYHGNGYWADLRGEFKANSNFAVNVKTTLTHGTSSNGPTYLALIVPHVGITYRQQGFLGFDWETRLSDIDRQTVGTGLFIEDKETDGGYAIAKQGIFTGKLMVDGTGSFTLDGGVIALDFNLWDGLLGGTTLIQETETPIQPAQVMSTVYSRHEWKNEGLGFAAEYGGDQAAKAGMVSVKYETDFDRLHLFVKPQFRSYGRGILGSLPRHIEHNYVSYDQNDKPFTNLMDIFAFGDHVETYTAMINLEFAVNIFYHLYVESEFIDFKYHDVQEIHEAFFRTGVKFFPFKDRPEEFGFLIGNKYLIASTAQTSGFDSSRTYSSPDLPDFENKPLFMKQLYVMFNFSTHM
jgi:hypothetical protein